MIVCILCWCRGLKMYIFVKFCCYLINFGIITQKLIVDEQVYYFYVIIQITLYVKMKMLLRIKIYRKKLI